MNFRGKRKASVNGPTDISVILSKILELPNISEAMQEADLIAEWPNIVGEAIAKQVTLLGVQDEVLILRTSSSVWRSEVNFAKKAILSRTNTVLGKSIAKDLRFV